MGNRGPVFVVCAVVASGLALGCGLEGPPDTYQDHRPQVPDDGAAVAPEQDVRGTYVGFLDGTDTAIAFVVEGDNAFGYTCGTGDDIAAQTMWFEGMVRWLADGRVWIDCGAQALVAGIDDGVAVGYVIGQDGIRRDFGAPRVQPGTIAGIYSDRDHCATGAIVMQDGPDDAPFVQGAWCNGAGMVLQVTPMSPVQVVDDALAVEIPIRPDDPTERVLFSIGF